MCKRSNPYKLKLPLIAASIWIIFILSGFTINNEHDHQVDSALPVNDGGRGEAIFVKNSEQGYDIIPCRVQNDTINLEFFQVKNKQGIPVFYYQDINQYPCDDSVCERMELRIYWDMWGNFLKIALEGDQRLTKIGHQPFTDKDYERLHKLLNDPKCNIQYYKLDNLTDKDSEKLYYSVDAVSSATIKNITYDSVKGAVKTCYTLWKIVNCEIRKFIKNQTAEALRKKFSGEQIGEMIQIIQAKKVPSARYLKTFDCQIDLQNTIYLFCLLELNRYSPETPKDFFKNLTDLIDNSQSVSETAIYNYLLQEDFNKKEVRCYKPSQDYYFNRD